MKKVKYTGVHDAVDLELPAGGEIVVEHKQTIEVDDDFAQRLVEQEANWEPVGWKPKPKPNGPDAAAPDSDQPADDAGEIKE